jgi:L-lactate permease
MTLVAVAIWPQPLDPLNSTVLSALVAALPLILILVLMGGLRKSGLFASACGLAAAGLLAMLIWHMPLVLLFVEHCLWVHLCALAGSVDCLRWPLALQPHARHGQV